MGFLKNGTAQLKLSDSNGDEHVMVEASQASPPRFLLQNPGTHKLQDVTGKLVP